MAVEVHKTLRQNLLILNALVILAGSQNCEDFVNLDSAFLLLLLQVTISWSYKATSFAASMDDVLAISCFTLLLGATFNKSGDIVMLVTFPVDFLD